MRPMIGIPWDSPQIKRTDGNEARIKKGYPTSWDSRISVMNDPGPKKQKAFQQALPGSRITDDS